MIPESSSLPNDHVLKQLLILVKGFRNGLVYGAKIRFPHALVMSMLFREGRLGDKMRWVLMATKQHAWNLGRMAVIFKLMLFLLNWSFPRNLTRAVDLVDHDKMLEAPSVIGDWRPFVAGLVGGYLIFGTNDPINNQIVMYLFSRVIHGLIATVIGRRAPGAMYPAEAAIIWGLVMWLFYNHRGSLQSSLQASMQYIYVDSEQWRNLWTLLVHNQQ